MPQEIPTRVAFANNFIMSMRATRVVTAHCRLKVVEPTKKEQAALDAAMDVVRQYCLGETFSDEPLGPLDPAVLKALDPPAPPDAAAGEPAKLAPKVGDGGGAAVMPGSHSAPAAAGSLAG